MTRQNRTGDAAIRERCDAGEYVLAATEVLRLYEAEVTPFIRARLRDDADVQDVLSLFREDVWQGLPGFAWKCSLLAWLYKLAHHALCRFTTSRMRRRSDHHPLSQHASLRACERSATSPFQNTAAKSRLRKLRERLSDADQALLVLRVD